VDGKITCAKEVHPVNVPIKFILPVAHVSILTDGIERQKEKAELYSTQLGKFKTMGWLI
jgi:hypothetical protein